MTQTLDQKRAAFAWECADAGMKQHPKEYKTLAKGAPALIMNSGLMPTLAYYKGKGDAAEQLLDDLIRGLSFRLGGKTLAPGQGNKMFEAFMRDDLQKSTSHDYLRYTDEALELLKWIRQFVDAVPQGGRNAAA